MPDSACHCVGLHDHDVSQWQGYVFSVLRYGFDPVPALK
ncbi:hypothetical protein NSND_63486 [Nitrospira sp. ND1]|nr:hypothetical protein NSND_63486 [Nitrospira sp. ND1]